MMGDPTRGTDVTASHDELRNELKDLNEKIRLLGGENDTAFDQIGQDETGPMDAEDVGVALTNAEENAALLAPLYARRTELREQLKG